MRNSIQGPLLRTGNNSSFKALGETGYPVFKMAFQLREAIYRLDAGRDLARHLAIPQNDLGGDRTDWYSSFAGDVIPWSGATESERTTARQQFTEFQMAVQALSEQMLNADNGSSGGDRRVFAQLLKSVTHFPGNEFLYLVNGVLVITFWGFVHPEHEQRNPMHWLQPGSVASQMPVTPVVPPVAQPLSSPTRSTATHTVEAVTHSRRWSWRWLLGLLVALLSLALILGLLRSCAPSFSFPGLSTLSGDQRHSQPVSDAASSQSLEAQSVIRTGDNPSVGSDVISGDRHAPVAAPSGADPLLSGAGAQALSAPLDNEREVSAPLNDAPVMEAEATPAPPAIPETQASEPLSPKVASGTVPPIRPSQGEPLTLPATLPDGPAQFLNGQWQVNGGIQDKHSGRPLQLQYNFKQGKGTVSVRQSNGVVCTGPAEGSVREGALNIANPKQMTCSDQSNFIGPTITCRSPASGHADCAGNNDGDKTFPIRMLQPHS
ncbi:SrfA family protein [Pantoea sp. M_9]|uniref:SrfA family protein n=1 Tax=Pantoea sp. M_9 TaxID=2608041 RepID=UPI001232777C|nr:SrfA family protein [Pantoea sp. M_9]KAA5971627.1 hypothetical protein F3I15_05600 [Pantoea sp. M_9]